ncbi:hypothetical protein [Actinomycetospora soli]|uniref:hypothetical protein n=1 Tax=Actinomycetospora soli TaxID=2893887 RepID=UPI001E5851B8|nr:hypothetical protein [Actinomycetospora soli]MCD2188889.1 hypothetical protein [Actinomycetospora soli]
MKVDSLLQREGRDPVERTGPIPLPGRRPRHLAGPPRGRPVHPEAVTEPIRVAGPTAAPGRPGARFAVPPGAFPVPTDVAGDVAPDAARPAVGTPSPAVPRERDPRPTPAGGVPVGPALPRGRDARPAPPRRPDDGPPAVRRVPDPEAPVAVTPERQERPVRSRRRRWFRRSRTTLVVVLALLAAAAAAAGVAVAAWFASGSGSPGLDGRTALAPTTTAVAGSAVTTGLLTPGSTGTAVLSVSNPNPYRVRVTTIAPAGAATASGGTGTCATTGVAFVAQSPTGVVLAPAAGTTLTLPGAVGMSTASETGCQGATFSVPVTVTVVSAP